MRRAGDSQECGLRDGNRAGIQSNGVSYLPGRSAKWYLSQSGGVTQLADKKAVFVIRADGSVIASQNNSGGLFSGNPLNAALRPGDSIVVPEKAPKIGAGTGP